MPILEKPWRIILVGMWFGILLNLNPAKASLPSEGVVFKPKKQYDFFPKRIAYPFPLRTIPKELSLATIEKAWHQSPSNSTAKDLLARYIRGLHSGQGKQILPKFRLLLKTEYLDASSKHLAQAEIYSWQHKFTLARKEAQKVPACAMERPKCLPLLGAIARGEAKASRAIALAQKLHQQLPLAVAYLELALAWETNGDYQKSLHFLYEALKREDIGEVRTSIAIRKRMARLYRRIGMPKAARKVSQEWRRLQKEASKKT